VGVIGHAAPPSKGEGSISKDSSIKMKGTVSLLVASLIALGSSHLVESTPVVHVISHSHCDAGYRQSFDDYWNSSVSFIINSVLDALDKDPDKRFVWEEVSFLSKWWKQASNDSRELIKKLHSNGQLEFIGGGWVMHDEANPSLFGILNQMYQGLSFLRETFNARPRVEWHIDPFGHSLFMPELYSLLGYEAVIINRIPDEVKQAMRRDKGLEFYWQYSHPRAKSSSPIFTHVLDTHYGTPKLLGLDTQSLVYELVPILKKRLQWFKTDQLLLPFGGDFNFKVAGMQFSKMDAIMKYINANSSTYNMTLRYSTLSEYFNAIKSTSTTFDTRTNDFFPYVPCYPCGAPQCENEPCGPASQSNAYWSGFYTSKPAQKLLVREHEAMLKSLEVLNALHPVVSEEMTQSVELGRNTSALLQHHDAITGTSYPSAFDDYNVRLNNAMKINNESIANLKVSV
jgi:lysosomal alpha-mannosidase